MRGIRPPLIAVAVLAATLSLTATTRASFVVFLEVVRPDGNGNFVTVDSQTLTDVNGDGVIVGAAVNLQNYEFTSLTANSTLNDSNRSDSSPQGRISILGNVRRLTSNVDNELLRITVTDTGFNSVLPELELRNDVAVSFTRPPGSNGSPDFTYGLSAFVDPENRPFGLDPSQVESPLPEPGPDVFFLFSPEVSGVPGNETRTDLTVFPIPPDVLTSSLTVQSSIYLSGDESLNLTFSGKATVFSVPEPMAGLSLLIGGAGWMLLRRHRRRDSSKLERSS